LDIYLFGFQAQEKDDEIFGTTGSAISYKYRIHDARIGRFFSVDPLAPKYPHNSPYAFSENRLIDGIELEGLEYTDDEGKFWGAENEDEYQKEEKAQQLQEDLKILGSQLPEINQAYDPGTITAKDPIKDFFNDAAALHPISYDLNGLARSPAIQGAATGMLLGYGAFFAKDFMVAYAKTALTASTGARLLGGITDATGQLAVNWYSTGSFEKGFKGINWMSSGMTALNPTNLFSTYAFNGIVSNTFQFNLDDGWKFGTTNDVLIGTAGEISFGLLGGKAGNGFMQNTLFKSKLNVTNALDNMLENISINGNLKMADGWYKLSQGYAKTALFNQGVVFPSISLGTQTTKSTTINLLNK
jgi:hypothetical protein